MRRTKVCETRSVTEQTTLNTVSIYILVHCRNLQSTDFSAPLFECMHNMTTDSLHENLYQSQWFFVLSTTFCTKNGRGLKWYSHFSLSLPPSFCILAKLESEQMSFSLTLSWKCCNLINQFRCAYRFCLLLQLSLQAYTLAPPLRFFFSGNENQCENPI